MQHGLLAEHIRCCYFVEGKRKTFCDESKSESIAMKVKVEITTSFKRKLEQNLLAEHAEHAAMKVKIREKQ